MGKGAIRPITPMKVLDGAHLIEALKYLQIGHYIGKINAATSVFLDSFVQYCQSLGQPASVVDNGTMEDVGYVSQSSAVLEQLKAVSAPTLRGPQLPMKTCQLYSEIPHNSCLVSGRRDSFKPQRSSFLEGGNELTPKS